MPQQTLMSNSVVLGSNMKCEECEKENAVWRCEECGQGLCAECDESLHKKGKRQAHLRSALSTSDPSAVSPPPPQSSVLVFWEMSGLYPRTIEEAKNVLLAIAEVHGAAKEVRAYAQNFIKLGAELRALGIDLVTRDGVTDYQSLIMDVMLKSREDRPAKFLVLSSGAGRLKPFLCELAAALPAGAIRVATSLENLNFISPEDMPQPALLPPARLKPISHDYKETRLNPRLDKREPIPEFQQWMKKVVTGGVEGRLLDFLKSYANQGKIMTEIGSLVSGFQHYAIVKAEQARSAVQVMLTANLIHLTNRSFGTLKTVTFVSLRTESMSLELLLWTLRSLKNDQMLPTERAILSRMKEAFDLKPSPAQWQLLLDVVIERGKRHHSLSAPDITVLTTQSRTPIAVPQSSIPNFIVQEVLDSLTNQDTKVVYPEGEKWVSLDNNVKPADAQAMRESGEWRIFLAFLEDYFSPEESKHAWRRSEEEKTISGGRYGCAQFVKFCGPEALRGCSLGKLSFMVQLAINDDILRYQKTLLIWTPSTSKNEQYALERLRQVQSSIVECLKDCPEGVSLAQLPLKLRAYLPFALDLGELGFAKLKDLLATVPTVRVELRGSSQPFAVYIGHSAHTSASDSDAQVVLSTLRAIMGEQSAATPATVVESELTARLGGKVNWRSFDCASIAEFAVKWGGPAFEVLKTSESHIALQFSHNLSNSFYQEVPAQKVVMVSDLPEEFQDEMQSEPQFRSDSEEFHPLFMQSDRVCK